MAKEIKEQKKAVLALESGRLYSGESFGAAGERLGEVVFNTSLTGYQEILTDPSYKGQIIVMTGPHIGNIGVNPEDVESAEPFCEGFVVRERSSIVSNWRAQESLQKFLAAKKIPAVSGIDTRELTKHVRDVGAMRGILSTVDFDPKSLLRKIKSSPQMAGQDLAKEVTCKKSYGWEDLEWSWHSGDTLLNSRELSNVSPERKYKIVVIDYGVKHNILRCLTGRGAKVTVVPAQAGAQEILALRPDGVMLSNGPGDPAAVSYGIRTIRDLIAHSAAGKTPLPIFGICLGHQLLGHALGGRTYKLKFGHRGANHPVKDLLTGKIEITTQNHGFAVDIDSLAGKDVELTHINLNDQTLEGLRHKKLPLFSVQYHPESSGGPHDSRYLFDRFLDQVKSAGRKK